MAVYVIPRNRNNIWWGGGRGGGSGILDLLGQALIQPMLQRDALARQFNYQQRLEADDRAYRMGILDRIARGIDARGDMPVGAGDTIAGLVGAGANLKDFQGYYVPQVTTTDYGNRKEIRSVNQWDTDPIVGAVGLSPKEAEDVALAKRGADLAERQFADANALEWYVARQNAAIAANNARGGGKAADPYAGINAAANLFEAISKFNPGGSGGAGSLNIPGMEGLGGGTQQPPIDMSETLSLANRLVTEELNHRYGPAPGNGLTFDNMLALNGGVFGGSPMLSDFNNGLPPEAGMEDTATITPQPTTPQPQSAGTPSFRERLRDWRTGDAPVAVPGTPQVSAKKLFVSAAAVARYAKEIGISEEQARDELARRNSM